MPLTLAINQTKRTVAGSYSGSVWMCLMIVSFGLSTQISTFTLFLIVGLRLKNNLNFC